MQLLLLSERPLIPPKAVQRYILRTVSRTPEALGFPSSLSPVPPRYFDNLWSRPARDSFHSFAAAEPFPRASDFNDP